MTTIQQIVKDRLLKQSYPRQEIKYITDTRQSIAPFNRQSTGVITPKITNKVTPTKTVTNTSNKAVTNKVPINNNIQAKQTTKSTTRKGMRISGYNATGNPMANGKMPTEGYVATSDRSIPLGTKVIIDGKTYTVGDRTAKWIGNKKDPRYKGDTIDIFYNEPKAKTLQRGVKFKDVQFLN